MPPFVSLCDAQTQLSALVDRAAAGEEIVITKKGMPYARLVAITGRGEFRKPANAMLIDHIAADSDEADSRVEALFARGGG